MSKITCKLFLSWNLGCPSDKTLSIADEALHRGDGDQAGNNEESEDDFVNGGIITENSPLETVQGKLEFRLSHP